MRDGASRAGEAGAGPGRRGAGELEAAVLEVLQRGGSALSPGEVRELIGGDLAYTTVVTILSRLHAKGVLEPAQVGPRLPLCAGRRLAGAGRPPHGPCP